MKIVVDDKIPYIQPTLRQLAAEVVAKGGADITPADVRDADALIVRTRTRCDEALLADSSVQLVATATIGYDHIDTDYLHRAGIRWTNCPGCNSGSVAQYVECALLLLQREKGIRLDSLTIGIVGYGHVGSKVAQVARRLGLRVLVNDPPLGHDGFVSLDQIACEADIITFHVPLTRQEPYATWHLADADFLQRLARRPYLINTSRGEVVDNAALLQALDNGTVRDAVLDVWEGEPHVLRPLLDRVFLGTPHIAGYSADGKVNADNMVVDALCRHFHLTRPPRIMPPALPEDVCFTGDPLQLYDPSVDSRALKARPDDFESLRNHYPLRRERADLPKV